MNDQVLPEVSAESKPQTVASDVAEDAVVSQAESAVAVDDEIADEEFSEEELLGEDDFEAEEEVDDDSLSDDAAFDPKDIQQKLNDLLSDDPIVEELSELDVLTLEEAAIYLKVEYSDVRNLVKEKGLPGRKIGGEWRFLRGAIADWLRHPEGTASAPKKPARSERFAEDDKTAREARPRRRFSEVEEFSNDDDVPPTRSARPRSQFRSQNQFQAEAGSYPPPRRGRYDNAPAQDEYRPPRKRPPFRSQDSGPPAGEQFGAGRGGAEQEGGRRFSAGPRKSKREALNNQRFKRLDRRRFGGDAEE